MTSTADAELPELYSRSAAIWLWVEDGLTRDYLRAAWGNPLEVAFRITGRADAIEPILNDAVAGKQKNVFGSIDRDFGTTNYPEWTAANKTFRRFILPVHEIENFLLDSQSLAGCGLNTHGRSADEIEARLRAVAREQRWWMACRSVIAEIRERFFADFMEHPRVNAIATRAAAEKCILKSAWLAQLQPRANQTTEADIKQKLAAAHQQFNEQLKHDNWKEVFSGKEIFSAVRGWLYVPPPPPPSPSTSVQNSDLARSAAEWQVEHGKVPEPVIRLLEVLRQRVAQI